MKDESGQLNILLIPFILVIILFLGSAGFGVWAYMGRQDYKDHSDQKSEAAVKVAVDKTKSEKDNEFLEREKEPLKNYVGPESLGTIRFKYPKTWSSYVTQTGVSGLSVLSNPDYVTGDVQTNQMLKVEVVSQTYSQVISTFDGQVKNAKLTASAYKLPKVPSDIGVRFDGTLSPTSQGAMVVLPLRDKTIKISTETQSGLNDFNNIILPNFEFQP